jgi:hypothetical protein
MIFRPYKEAAEHIRSEDHVTQSAEPRRRFETNLPVVAPARALIF